MNTADCPHEHIIDQQQDGGPRWCTDCGAELESRRVTGPTGDPLGAVEW